MSPAEIAAIILLIALNAFFVCMEYAVSAARRARLDVETDAQSRGTELVRRWLDDDSAREKLITAARFGVLLSSIALGAVGVNALKGWIEPAVRAAATDENARFVESAAAGASFLLALLIVISLQVVFGEQMPKIAALKRPERLAAAGAPLMQLFIGLSRGFILLLSGMARAVLTVFGSAASEPAQPAVVSVDDLRQIVTEKEAAGMIELPESQMLSAVIDFGSLVARQVSVPRTEVIAIQSAEPIESAARIAMKHRVTKLPVYDESLDQIAGIVHLKDLLPALLAPDGMKDRPAGELAREALFVPESIPVNDLLVQMRARRQHIAITLDEFGGTAGLVTLEDLLEEIVGDVRDPFDVHQPDIQPLSDGTALVDGMTLIEEVNAAFGAMLYDPDYDTIAGYMLGKLGRIAQVGDEVKDAESGFLLRVESMDRLRIARIHLSRLSENP